MNRVPTIPDQKFASIAQTLLQKTKAGEVNWVKVPGREMTYEVVLPESKIVISYTTPRALRDFISLELCKPDGVRVGFLKAERPEPEDDDEPDHPDHPGTDQHWEMLYELFTEVHRSVTGWDKVLKDVEDALASQGPIGTPVRR